MTPRIVDHKGLTLAESEAMLLMAPTNTKLRARAEHYYGALQVLQGNTGEGRIVLEPRPSWNVRGRVRDDRKEPLAGANLLLSHR